MIETLDAAGLDWLSRDIIEGILAGNVEEASSEQLAALRAELANGQTEFVDGATIQEPALRLDGDEQVRFAADLVSDRLECLLIMMAKSINRLDFIVAGRDAAEVTRPQGAQMAIREQDLTVGVDGEAIARALEIVEMLKNKLVEWRDTQAPPAPPAPGMR